MRVAARQDEDIARPERERGLSFALHDARALEHDVEDRLAGGRGRVIQFQRSAKQAAQIERTGKVRELDQAVEGIKCARSVVDSTGYSVTILTLSASRSSLAGMPFLRVSVFDTLDISSRSHAMSVGWSGCGSES